MRKTWILCLALAGGPAGAADPGHVARLLETKTCFACDLRGADFSGASLSGADFSSSDLTGASLAGADLRNAEFQNANLTGTDFSFADLRYSAMKYANITGTVFRGARLDDVFIHAEHFTPVVDDGALEVARICGVRMPDGRMERSGCLEAME